MFLPEAYSNQKCGKILFKCLRNVENNEQNDSLNQNNIRKSNQR